MQRPDDSEPYEEVDEEETGDPGAKTDPSRRWFLVVVVLFVVALTGFIAAKPVYRVVKRHRAQAIVPEAQAALDRGDMVELGRKVRILLGLAPQDPEVLRLTARYCTRSGNPEGLNYWNLLLAQPSATRADRLAAIEFAQLLNRLDVSQPHLKRLFVADPTDREALRLQTRHFQLAGDSMAARMAARQWIDAHPTDTEAEFALGTILIEARDEATRGEGARLLWGLAAGESRWSEAASQQLGLKANLNRAEAGLLIRRLREKPSTRLAAERLRLRFETDQREQIIADVASSVSPEAPISELVPVVSWLTEVGALESALALMPWERSATNAALLSVRAQILLEQRKFDEVDTLLRKSIDGTNTLLVPYVAECLAAMKAKQQGNALDVAPHLEAALAAANRDPRALAFVAGYAEYLEAPRTAMTAHLMRLDWPPALLQSASEAHRLARLIGDEVAIHTAIRRLSDALPGDEGLKALEAYQASIIKKTPAIGRDALASLQKAHAEDLMFRAALALVDLQAGRPAEALGLLDAVEVDWAKSDPRWHAIYVACLAANLQREAARTHAHQIDLSKLTASERLLLDGAR